MNLLLNSILTMSMGFMELEKQMCEEFKRRAELDKQKYWDACKYPHKVKKRMRKEAIKSYELHIMLSNSIMDNIFG